METIGEESTPMLISPENLLLSFMSDDQVPSFFELRIQIHNQCRQVCRVMNRIAMRFEHASFLIDVHLVQACFPRVHRPSLFDGSHDVPKSTSFDFDPRSRNFARLSNGFVNDRLEPSTKWSRLTRLDQEIDAFGIKHVNDSFVHPDFRSPIAIPSRQEPRRSNERIVSSSGI